MLLIKVKQILTLIIMTVISVRCLAEAMAFGDMIKRGRQYSPVANRTHDGYQKCLSTLTGKREAEALLMVEGNRVLLTCPICLPPKIEARGIWRRRLADQATFMSVYLDGNRARILADLSLEISNAWIKDSGIYLCFKDSEVMAKYSVDVVKLEPHRYIVMNGRKKQRKRTWQDLPLNNLNLVVSMSWSEWSECSRCELVGRRRRVGICMVRKINIELPTKPEDCRNLNEFRKGIPCRSELLPKKLRDISDILNTKSEFVIGFCKIPCPSKASIVVVTDKSGKILDTVDNSQGVYSMHQPLPKLPPLVKRRAIYEEVGRSVIMSCPGNSEGKFLIWRNESFHINPSKVHKLTKGRVKIDLANNLFIRKLRYSDTATYSCWNNNKLIGTIRLQVVNEEMGRSYRVFVLNTAILFTFIVILIISVTVCRNVKLQSKE